jgi:membrane-bound metal-dependent hydrolase YbcI (DUF457 family)
MVPCSGTERVDRQVNTRKHILHGPVFFPLSLRMRIPLGFSGKVIKNALLFSALF